jgi:hypothetical protein
MERVKCVNCGLVNTGFDHECRRCSSLLSNTFANREQSSANSSLTIPVRPILFLVLAGAAAYWYFGGNASSDQASTRMDAPAGPTPRPSLSLRRQNEQRVQGAYFEAIKQSPGISVSDKRLAETNKLMETGGASPDR